MTCTSLSCSSAAASFSFLAPAVAEAGEPSVAAVFFDSSSFFFWRTCFARSSGFELLVKTIDLPSGDHFGSLAPFGRSVKTKASPPDIERRHNCGGCFLPSFSIAREKTRNFPSGDQRGPASRGPLVSCRGASSAAVGTIQIALSYAVLCFLKHTSTE